MLSEGHEVEVLCCDNPGAAALNNFPLLVHALGHRYLFYGFSPKWQPWLNRNASSYDIVIVNGLWQYPTLAVWRALRGSTTPYVVFTHGMLDPWFRRAHPLKHLKKLLYWRIIERRVLRDAAAVLFTCEEERLLARQSFSRYEANEVVVPLGTVGPGQKPYSGNQELLAKFPRLDDKRLILFLGRIHPKKGCDLAIQAFANTFAGDECWHLVMAGPDQVGWRHSLVRLSERLGIADQITWTGMIEGDLKWQILHAAETLFLPSHQENFGIVVAEALACGLPVLISDKVNIWREIAADNAGMVASDDAAGATWLLRQWADLAPQDRTRMRKNARTCFQARFEIRAAGRNFLSVLSALASENTQSVSHRG
jgi:glycosyltransferase involved in cell wall biosynthesis